MENINLKIAVIQDQLNQVITNSELPVTILSLILKDTYKEIEALSQQAIMKENEEMKKKMEEAGQQTS